MVKISQYINKKWIIVLVLSAIGLVLIQFQSNQKSFGKKASCQSCHEMSGFVSGHQNISCTSCHLGDSDSHNMNAHKGMISIPGNLEDVSITCSQSGCHVGIDHRVKNSLMNTMSGVVAVNKFVFGENNNLDAIHHIEDLGVSASDTHLRQLCASCHLGNKRVETGPISELTRGGGCNACHLNYDTKTTHAHFDYLDSGKEILPSLHPQLSLNVSDDHCFGCHSRSARISTNYEGWHELVNKENTNFNVKTRRLQDGRLFEFINEDIHHKLGLECIDCHSANEVMGDGNTYAHEGDAVKVECADCHQSTVPKFVDFEELDVESQTIVQLRGLDKRNQYLVNSNGDPIYNVFFEKDELVFLGKNSKKRLVLSKPSSSCTAKVHSNVTCEACHTSWAPQCISCHTSFDTTKLRFDHLSKEQYQGKWVEKGNLYLGEYPTLGIIKDNEISKIKTFIQGMTMTLDQTNFSNDTNLIKHIRRFAPTFSHTISKKGQSCSSCHLNSVALGYGRGKLEFNSNGQRKWKFHPKMSNSEDGLPEDAWIAFLSNEKGNATRKHASSLPLIVQKKMLKVGACLTCHDDNSKVSQMLLNGYDEIKHLLSSDCIQVK